MAVRWRSNLHRGAKGIPDPRWSGRICFSRSLNFMWLFFVAAASSGGVKVTRKQDCEVCGLLMWRLEDTLQKKKLSLERFKQDMEKRAEKISKAHSKRWLRGEYPVELVVALEGYIDTACEEDQLLHQTTCKKDEQNGEAGSALRRPAKAAFDWHVCRSNVKKRCKAVVDDHAEELVTSALQNGTAAGCAEIVPKCIAARAMLLMGPLYAARIGEAPSAPGARLADEL